MTLITVKNKAFTNTTWDAVSRSKELYERCDFNDTLMTQVCADDITFKECTLEQAEWRGSSVENVSIDRCFAPNLQFSDDTEVSRLKIYESVIDGATFADTTIEESKIECPISSVRMSFINCELKNVAFLQANMRGAIFQSCTLEGVVFRQVELENSAFIDCSFKNCVFLKTSLVGCLVACSKHFETSKFLGAPIGCVRLYEEAAAEKACSGLMESALSIKGAANFINYDQKSRPSMFFVKDLAVNVKNPHQKQYILNRAAYAAGLPSAAKVSTSDYDWDKSATKYKVANKACLFFSPGLKEMLVS